MNTKFLSVLFLALSCLGVRGQDRVHVSTHDLTFDLPVGWEQIENPKVAYDAGPREKNGGTFVLIVEPSVACPVPQPIDQESDFEKGFWGRFDSNFAASSHSTVIGKDFQMVNGIPFRIVETCRETGPGSSGKLYFQVAATPGNGNIYELAFVKKGGGVPLEDADMQALLQSVKFAQPPRIAWYQSLIPQSNNIFGMPLLLVSLGMGIYLIATWGGEDVPNKRNISIATWGLLLGMLNTFWVAGLESWCGIVSYLGSMGFGWAVFKLNKQRRAMIAEGKVVGPTRKVLKRNFWILLGAVVLGLVISDLQLSYSGASLLMIISSDVFTMIMVGIIFWFQRKKFFPEADSAGETKS